MVFQQYLPSPHLQSHIAYYWTLKSETPISAGNSYNMVADGYVDWVFHLGEPWAFSLSKKNKEKKKFHSHLFGHTKSHINIILPDGPLSIFCIKFQPWAAHNFWEINMNNVTDLQLSFSEMGARQILSLEEKIQESKNILEIIKMAESFLEKKLWLKKNDDLNWAVKHIFKHCSLENLPSNISTRRLEQRFKNEIGISPKLLQRTVRINRVIQEIIRLPKPRLTDIAYQFGYFDQSHFIREFQQFTGVTPTKFLQSINPSGEIFNLKIN